MDDHSPRDDADAPAHDDRHRVGQRVASGGER